MPRQPRPVIKVAPPALGSRIELARNFLQTEIPKAVWVQPQRAPLQVAIRPGLRFYFFFFFAVPGFRAGRPAAIVAVTRLCASTCPRASIKSPASVMVPG